MQIQGVDPEMREKCDSIVQKKGAEKDQQKCRIVERKDAQGAAIVKASPPVRMGAIIPENATDEEPGEQKEESNAEPSCVNADANQAYGVVG